MNKKVKGIIVLSILLLLSTGCGIYPSQDAKQLKAEKLTILESKLNLIGYGYVTIQGQAQNISNRQLRYAEIRAKFYDNNGEVVESSRTNTLHLMPNEIWGFEIHCVGNTRPIAKYEISIAKAY